MIIAVDFDKTLSLGAHYPYIGEPNTELISILNQLQALNHTIILWTCRESKELNEAVEWLKTQGLTPDYVNCNVPWLGFDCRKIVADYYIDDCAVHVHDTTKIKAILHDSKFRHNDCQG